MSGAAPPGSSIRRVAPQYAISAAGCATVAESPLTRMAGAMPARRETHSANWSPRLVPASACTSSITTRSRPANRAGAPSSDSSRARLSGVVSRMFGGASRWRLRRLVGVSPVRVSIVTASPISATGAVRLRAMSVASAFSGLTYSVCSPSRGASCRPIRLGRNPASVLPPPVGAISSTDSPARAAASIAN